MISEEVKTKKKASMPRKTIRQRAFELKLKQAIADPEAFAEKEGKLTLENIAKSVGYAKDTARNTHKIRRKESFALTVEDEVNMINKYLKKAYEVLEREHDSARYQDATQAIERLSKQKQLLTGHATENIAFKIIEEEEETAQ